MLLPPFFCLFCLRDLLRCFEMTFDFRSSRPLPVCGGPALVGDPVKIFQEFFALSLAPIRHHFRLQTDGDLPDSFELGVPRRKKPEAVRAAIAFMPGALDPSGGFHSPDQRPNGVRIARDQPGQMALGQALRIVLGQVAQGGELIRGDARVGQSAAEGLVQAEPRLAQ
jgi:hypothetical protein